MRPWVLALILIPVAACSGPTVDGGTTVGRPAVDASSRPGARPACPAQKPGGYCDAAAASPVCTYGEETCRCLHLCTGRQPPPGRSHTWICRPPSPAACPSAPPADGGACKPDGLYCTYGYCGATLASCTSGVWSVRFVPGPP